VGGREPRLNRLLEDRPIVGPASRSSADVSLAKTGLRDRAQLVRYAYRTGLAHPEG